MAAELSMSSARGNQKRRTAARRIRQSFIQDFLFCNRNRRKITGELRVRIDISRGK
jgi:hypothetical protein